jgi:hypothetical protein
MSSNEIPALMQYSKVSQYVTDSHVHMVSDVGWGHGHRCLT